MLQTTLVGRKLASARQRYKTVRTVTVADAEKMFMLAGVNPNSEDEMRCVYLRKKDAALPFGAGNIEVVKKRPVAATAKATAALEDSTL